MDEVDKDKSGQVGFEEFKKIMTKTINDPFTQNSSIEAFAVFDEKNTGKLDKKVIQEVLEKRCGLDQNDIDELLKNVTFDDNNQLTYSDFVNETFNMFK